MIMTNLLLTIAELAIKSTSADRSISIAISSKMRIVGLAVILSLFSLILAGSALNLIIADILQSSQVQKQLALTSVSGLGLAVVFISFFAILLLFKKSFWGISSSQIEADPGSQKKEAQFELTPLVQAISVLILDLVDERRKKRGLSSDIEKVEM